MTTLQIAVLGFYAVFTPALFKFLAWTARPTWKHRVRAPKPLPLGNLTLDTDHRGML